MIKQYFNGTFIYNEYEVGDSVMLCDMWETISHKEGHGKNSKYYIHRNGKAYSWFSLSPTDETNTKSTEKHYNTGVN